MANSPDHHRDSAAHFPAPPPSPVASGSRRSSFFLNDDILTDFLDHSLTVPDLFLPDRIFPRQIQVQNPNVIDFESLDDSVDLIKESVARVGCFQLAKHGIGREPRRAALDVFELAAEEKKKVVRSPERFFGYEEGEMMMSEEFVWGRGDEMLRLEMEGIWPLGYSNFSEKMEALSLEMEKLAQQVLFVLEKQEVIKPRFQNGIKSQRQSIDIASRESLCYIHKQCPNLGGGDQDLINNSLKYDVIKMLIRGSSDYSHALGLHVCDESNNEFHVYSKKGWFSFVPEKDAMVITVGDQIQTWSEGQYKNVIGRPIYRGEQREFISMAFLYSPTSNRTSVEETISIGQQAIIAVLFSFVYHFLVYIYM